VARLFSAQNTYYYKQSERVEGQLTQYIYQTLENSMF